MTTPDLAGLCERLREAAREIENDGTQSQVGLSAVETLEAAAAIERLVAENERIRAERDVLARQLGSLISPKIDHTGAKRRLMSMRRTALEGASDDR